MPVCRKCQNHFPISLRIDGDRRSLQNRRFCLVCSPYKVHNTKDLACTKLNPTERICPRCTMRLPSSEFYRRRGKEGYGVYCKSCTNRQAIERQQALKKRAVEYKGGCCSRCGYDRYIGSLEFHHVNPDGKDFTLAHAKSTSFENVKAELDKCLLLCANCHREEHARINVLL